MSAKSWTSVLFLYLSITACSENSSANIELSGLNYTNAWITEFSVNGYVGHGISPNGGGGKFVCCVNIPRKWHDGAKVTVRWIGDDRGPDLWKERIVEVPNYTEKDIGAFAVHFYPGDVVKVLVTTSSCAADGRFPLPLQLC